MMRSRHYVADTGEQARMDVTTTRSQWTTWLPVFGAIVISFVAATALSQWKSRAIDAAALEIAENSAPSIERLTTARREVRRLQSLVSAYGAAEARDPAVLAKIEESRAKLDGAIQDYLALPAFVDEGALWKEILADRDAFDRAVTHVALAREGGDRAGAAAAARSDVPKAAEALRAAISRDIQFNAGESQELALRIRTLRGGVTTVAFALDAACILIAALGAVLLRRGVRAHAALLERNHVLDEARASEMELFAGRVAHDILSPVGAVALALHVARESPDPGQRARALERGEAAVSRVKRLVTGLLDFARAGAKPDGNARADVAATVADLEPELRAAAKAGSTELVVDVTRCAAACNPGVLTSLVANLARNAIKYIGDGDERRVEIRAREHGDRVRVEVKDTGPGLPPGLEEHVFDPYVRGRGSAQPGIGLGLATVKRVADAHGGRVGVRSVPGEGCTFWFELPRARAARDGD
jgi:signal transduction histidine kinase